MIIHNKIRIACFYISDCSPTPHLSIAECSVGYRANTQTEVTIISLMSSSAYHCRESRRSKVIMLLFSSVECYQDLLLVESTY